MRKHHNKLYYGKYRYKTIFKIPGSLMFYPTTDKQLMWIKKEYPDAPDMNKLADFIMQHRENMRFRMQDKKAIFYSDQGRSNELINKFGTHWIKTVMVDPKLDFLDHPNTVGCFKLPHGKYPFAIVMKRDLHKHFSNTEKEALLNFVDRNIDHCLITSRFLLDYLEGKEPYCYHGRIYVDTEKFLSPIYMIAQKGIDRILKYVKINYESNKKTSRA